MQVYIYLMLLFFLECALVVACPAVSWFCLLRGNTHSIKQSVFTGALSGLFGTLIWPTGYLIWYCIANINHLQMGGIIVIFITVLITGSMFVGAAIAAVLTSTRHSQ